MDFVRPQSGAQATETTNTPPASPEPAREPVRQLPPKPKRKYTVFKMAILVILLLAALGGLGYLYYQEKQDKDSLVAENAALRGVSQANSATPGTSTTEPKAATTKYTAKVGKFTLELPTEYTIIRNLDSGFEGGPATQLEIATNLSDQQNVVSSQLSDKVTVFAKPLAESQSFEEFVTATLADRTYKKQANTTVAATQAQVYTIDGLGVSKEIYFTNNGIGYLITAENSDGAESKEVVDAVIKGFKFN